MIQKIAIVGAGWNGLQIAKVFVDCGYDVHLLEQLDDVGGTWHPSLAYASLAIHSPIYRCQFHDFDRHHNHDRMKRLASHDIFENCRAYAEENDLYRRISFGKRVVELRYDSRSRTCTLVTERVDGGERSSQTFDFVISTQFNSARIPSFAGQDGFRGRVVHSNDVKPAVVADIIKNRRKVVLLGASKAATDLAYLLTQRNYKFTWLAREAYWFLNYDKAYFDHKKGRPAPVRNRLLYYYGVRSIKGRRSLNLVFTLWRLAGMLHSPGRRHSDYRKFHHGWLDEHQVATLRTQTTQVYGDVASLRDHEVVLKDGRTLDCDLLICATGCDPIAQPIRLFVDGTALPYEDVAGLYRASVIPNIPRLCFTAFFGFGFGPLNGYHRAVWILKYIERDLPPETLREAAAREGAGKARKPFGHAMFDSSDYFLLRSQEKAALMYEGMVSKEEYLTALYDMSVRFRVKPLPQFEEYIRSRAVQARGRRPEGADPGGVQEEARGARPSEALLRGAIADAE